MAMEKMVSEDGYQQGADANTKKKKAHILIVPIASRGHFTPFMQLIYHLDAKYSGLTVTMMGNKDRIADLTRYQSHGDLKNLDLRLEEVFGPVPVYHADPKFPVRPAIVSEANYSDCESLRKKLVADKDLAGGPTVIVADMYQYWSKVSVLNL